MQWHYTINRQQHGPVDESVVRTLISTGKIKKDDLVWNPDMGGQWKPAGKIFFPLFAGTINGPMDHREPGAPNGTGGKKPNSEITAEARAALSGNWGIAIGAHVIIYLISIAASFALALIPLIGPLVQIIITPPLMIGLLAFSLTLACQQKQASLDQIFCGFKCFGTSVGAYAMVAIYTFLWMLPSLLIMLLGIAFMPDCGISQYIPALPFELSRSFGAMLAFGGGTALYLSAIIASLRYSQVLFVLADNPAAGIFGSIKTSIDLMQGNKWKFIGLGLRFFGWALLCGFTMGIGFLWLYPYMTTSYACFYEDLKH